MQNWNCWRFRLSGLFGAPVSAATRFRQLAGGTEAWEPRIARLAAWIAFPGPVLDLGCGEMRLERYLRAGTPYVPIDCVARDVRTRVLDLDGPLPRLRGDVAVMSGVLEYLETPDPLLDAIDDCRQSLFSYCTLENHPWHWARRARGWRNHWTADEVVSRFRRRGWRVEHRAEWERNSLFDVRK